MTCAISAQVTIGRSSLHLQPLSGAMGETQEYLLLDGVDSKSGDTTMMCVWAKDFQGVVTIQEVFLRVTPQR